MVSPEPQFNEILGIFQEFGPRRKIPILQRWSEAFPNATPADFGEWRLKCEEIVAFAYEVAREFGPDLQNDIAGEKIQTRFPHLNRDRISATWNQARYFAWKDGL